MIALLDEFARMPHLEFDVVFIDGWTQANFLDMNDMLFLFTQLFFLAQLILVFAVIHDTAYRRRSIGSNFHEVEIVLVGNGSCFGYSHDS